MRLFISINLADNIKEAIMDVQDSMMFCGIGGNYTRPENMHITLAFIGELADPELVLEQIERVEVEPFTISLKGIGAFRGLWWIGLEESEELKTLARRIRRNLAEAGIPYDRKKFSPHITLVRRPDGELSDLPAEAIESITGVSMTVDHVSLMRSDRGKRGMVYKEIGR